MRDLAIVQAISDFLDARGALQPDQSGFQALPLQPHSWREPNLELEPPLQMAKADSALLGHSERTVIRIFSRQSPIGSPASLCWGICLPRNAGRKDLHGGFSGDVSVLKNAIPEERKLL